MKEIGILTWYYGANYGALAQSYALYSVINSFGYDCKMINYRPENYKKIIISANIPPKYKRLVHLKKTFKGLKKCKKLSVLDIFNETKPVYNANQIDKLNLDCIVLGSDAIFNVKHPLCNEIFYGVGIKTKKVTYSPSCEFLDPNEKLPQNYIESLLEMKTISVRDINTKKLIYNNAGVDSSITLDPTFLYDFKEIKFDLNFKDFLLIYSFSDWSKYKNEILTYAKDNKLKIVSIGIDLSWADYSFASASFEQWIESFRKAKVVITDSFHGVVFSLKNSKPFVLCGRSDKLSKINSLLNQVGLNINVYQGETLKNYFEINEIDYNRVLEKLTLEKNKSILYLKNALD